MEDFEFVSYIIGDLTFTEASTDADAPVEGSFSGELFAF